MTAARPGLRGGDLTDATGWERAWRRSARAGLGPRLEFRRVRYQRALFRELFAFAAERTHAPLEIIELGCAPGKVLRRLAGVGPEHRYSGVDFAGEALARMRDELAAAGLTATLHEADLRDFTPPHLYDLVMSFGLVEHFDDPNEIVRHHARLARPGGVVCVIVPNYAHPWLHRALERYSPETLRTHNLAVMSDEVLRDTLGAAGLVDLRGGCFGGAVAPTGRIGGRLERVIRLAVVGWNLAFELLPARASPWHGFLWAAGRRR